MTIAILFAAACSDYGINNGDDNDENLQIIEVEPRSLDFGAVAEDDSGTRRVFIDSLGEADLFVSGLEFTTEGASQFEVDVDGGFVLPPGARREVTVTVSGVWWEEITELLVHSDDTANPVIPVSLSVEPMAPELTIFPNPLDMGDVGLGCVRTDEVKLANTGELPLELTNIGHDGVDITIAAPYLPTTIQPGEQIVVPVTYVPTDDGSETATLKVLSNDPYGERTANQEASGVLGDDRTDSWELPEITQTDIVLYVDKSGSMDDDAAALAAQASNFIAGLAAYDIDWQMAVVTDTNSCAIGGVLKPTTPNLENLFLSAVTTGSGSDTESGLYAGRTAVAYANSGSCNNGFLRPDALLHLISVSDEEDQTSSYSYGDNWEDMVQDMVDIKGSQQLVVTSAVAGPIPSGCSAGGNSAGAGYGYSEAATATGGAFLSLCSNWSSSVDALASASYANSRFVLTEAAVPGTVEVWVDGSSTTTGWEFDELANAVLFDENAAPEPGSNVDISYALFGDCD